MIIGENAVHEKNSNKICFLSPVACTDTEKKIYLYSEKSKGGHRKWDSF